MALTLRLARLQEEQVKHVTRKRNMERKIVERLRLGDSIKKIGRELGVGRNSIRRVRDQATTAGYLGGTHEMPAYPEAIFSEVPDGRSIRGSPIWKELEGHIEWIKERLAAGWHAVTVYEELPTKVPRSSFYRLSFAIFLDRCFVPR